MRIVITSDLHWPARNGIATFGRTLAQGLAAAGHDVLVIAPSHTGKKHFEVDNNHKVARVSSVPFPLFPNYRLSVSPNLEVKKIIASFKPDVIHIQTPLGIGLAARRAAKKYNIAVVATNHAMPENILENLRAIGPLARPVTYLLKEYGLWFHSNNIDYITMPTQSAIDMYKDIERDLEVPLKAVSCGINLDRFTPGPRDDKLVKKYGIPKNKPIVLYAGRLDGEKHLSVLINAFYRVLKTHDVHLVISGGGNDEDNLKSQVNALGIDSSVSFLGRVSDDELPKVYRLGTVFAMPSPAELQSIVMLEAMATGLPTVAVKAGALPELCHNGKNGYLCKTDDYNDMAAKLSRILDDPKLQKKMGQKSLEIAKTHDIRHTVEQFEKVYKEAIKLRSTK